MKDRLLHRFCGRASHLLRRAVLLQCLKLIGSLAFSFAIAAALTWLGGIAGSPLYLGIAALLVLLVLRFAIARGSTRAQAAVVGEVKVSLRRALLEKLFRLGPSYHRYHPTQAVLHLGVEGVEQLENYFGGYLVQLYYCLIATGIVFLALAPFAWQPALLLLCLSPLIPLFLQLILRMVRRIQTKQWQNYTDVGTLFLDSLQGLTTLKLFGAGEAQGKKLADKAEIFRRSTMRVLAMQLNSITLIDLLAYGSIAGAFILSTRLFLGGQISLFAFYLSVLLAAEFFLPMRALTSLFHVAMLGVAAGHEMVEFLEAPEPDRPGDRVYHGDLPIHIDGLTYTWPGADCPAVDDLHLTLEPRKMTALVGLSGCGKSTLAAWLAGEIDDPDWLSCCRIGGLPGRDFAGPDWTRRVVRMSHESHIFQGSVRDNLLMGRPEATDQELIRVLQKVSLWETFASRDGLDTLVSSQGKNLSGGQAQRLAFARVLLMDASLYIFDEATSNVDVVSEAILLRETQELARQKTVLYISHRLDTMTATQQIYVMEQGRVVESGSHDELIALGGRYASWSAEQRELLGDLPAPEVIIAEAREEEAEEAAEGRASAETAEGGAVAAALAAEAVEGATALDSASDSTPDSAAATVSDSALRSGPSKAPRSGPLVMLKLIALITPLVGWVILAIIAGVLGFIASFGLAVLPVYAVLSAVPELQPMLSQAPFGNGTTSTYLTAMIVCAVIRALLHYGEQYCNHNIAFKLLARIRGQIYDAIHRLAPAKLDDADPGKLISILLGDIELLEVFYAHTLSPIAIAGLTAIALDIVFFMMHPAIGVVALVCQAIIGIVLPLIASRRASPISRRIRKQIGDLNGTFLDQLRGIRELIQFGRGPATLDRITTATKQLNDQQTALRLQASVLTAAVESLIQIAGILQVLVCLTLLAAGSIPPTTVALAVVLQISSFAPFVALASLGNTLTQTFACGNRVLDLLEESPVVPDNTAGHSGPFGEIVVDDVSFRYPGATAGLLQHCDLRLEPGERVGIRGRSGCGKSTLLKLILRFRDPDTGTISQAGHPLPEWNTRARFDQVCYMTQSAQLFTGSLRENLLLACPAATDEEMWKALDRAALTDRIRSCADGLDVQVNENAENFSGGERQRMALARCFLADRDLLILDEPTSNLDVINEALILRALRSTRSDQSILLVSHRFSTLGFCDRVLSMKGGRFVGETKNAASVAASKEEGR